MNRELKFRAWDNHEGKWLFGYEYPNLGGFSLIGEVVLFGELAKFSLDYYQHIVFMQYTGLHDKNGKEIYEGDILQIRTQGGRIEEFTCEYGIHNRSMASGWEVEIPGFAFVNKEKFPTFPILKNYLNGRDLDIIEVIGNIFETPELLNP